MGGWAGYFFGKGYLYFRGAIPLDVLLNLAFVVFLIIPLPDVLKRSRLLTIARSALGVVIAVLLAWHDSWLPTFRDVTGFLADGGVPTGAFMFQFLAGYFNPGTVGILAVLFAACIALRRHVRFAPLVVGLLLIIAVREYTQPKDEMGRYLASVYQTEAARVVRFETGGKASPDFDVVILHVCSLSWDDLRYVGLDNDPFFRQFDYVFTDFNSMTAYSAPSALRLLRATCGQTTQDALYRATRTDCYLFDALREVGYEPYAAFNHDGKYRGFTEEVRKFGHLDVPLNIGDLPIQQYDFNGSPLREDYSVLARWWALRQRSGARAATLYYNTTTLHDGGYWVGEKNWWKENRPDRYRAFVRKLFQDFSAFFDLVALSGRNTVILFVPEHGVALRGTTIQGPGLRDVPLPQITTVPVAVKLIGKQFGPSVPPRVIATPTSYLSLTHLLAALLKADSFGESRPDVDRALREMPKSVFVAENMDGVLIVKKGADYFLSRGSSKTQWVKLSPDVVSSETVSVGRSPGGDL